MKKRLLTAFYILLTLQAFTGAKAAIVEGLYEAEIIVPNQRKEERDQAMRTGLLDVLAKVSGRPDVGTMAGITQAAGESSRYLQQYQYRKVPDTGHVQSEVPQGSQLLWLQFDKDAVDKLLQKNHLPVWGRTRPATMVWLAVEQEGSRYLIGNNTPEELRFMLEAEASRRGLAVVLPLLDVEDQGQVQFADIWANAQEPIFRASARYRADAILVGRMSLAANDTWSGRWILYEGGQGLSWNSQGQQAAEIINSGVLGGIEILASRYAQVYSDSTPGVFDIAITDIYSIEQFARVSDYLKSLEPVAGVFPTRIDGNNVSFRLDIRGNSTGLVQTIALGNVLAAVAQQNPGTSGSYAGNFSAAGGQEIAIQETSGTTAHQYRLLP